MEPPVHYALEEAPKFQGRGAAFVLTVWNFGVNPEWEGIAPLLFLRLSFPQTHDEKLVQFFIGQVEIAPETGRRHLQCYFELKTQATFDRVHALDFLAEEEGTCWIRKARGSAQQNIAYCSKEESLPANPEDRASFRVGEPHAKGQGSRQELIRAREAVQAGQTVKDLVENDSTIGVVAKYPKFVQLLNHLYTPARQGPKTVTVFWGPTGTGKSYRAKRMFPDAYKVPHAKSSGLYFDGYADNDALLVEEMSGTRFPFQFLLDLLDPDSPSVAVPVHGGFVKCIARHYVFTSNLHPYQWYEKYFTERPEMWPCLERRMTNVIHLTERYEEPGFTHVTWPFPAPIPVPPPVIDNRVLYHE